MEIVRNSKAGTFESNDIFVMVKPWEDGIVIELESIVKEQFGEVIESTIRKKISDLKIENVYVKAQDKGALDYTISSRVETALRRALGGN